MVGTEQGERGETPEEETSRGKRESMLEQEEKEEEEKISEVRQELKEQGIEVDLYRGEFATREFQFGEINGHTIILTDYDNRYGVPQSAEIDGRKIDPNTAHTLSLTFFQEAAYVLKRPPKHLQVSVLEFGLRRVEEGLDVLKGSKEALEKAGLSGIIKVSGSEKISAYKEITNSIDKFSKKLEEERKKIEAFRKSEFDDILDFEAEMREKEEGKTK